MPKPPCGTDICLYQTYNMNDVVISENVSIDVYMCTNSVYTLKNLIVTMINGSIVDSDGIIYVSTDQRISTIPEGENFLLLNVEGDI